MRNLMFFAWKFQVNCISVGKKISLSSDFAAMLCFMLGVYGERFFLYVYSLLGAISPETFSAVCLLGTYSVIASFIHN